LLVGLKMQANRNRTSLTFLSPPPRVEDIFRVSKLNTIFEILSGPEADVIQATLKKDEYCLWSDSKDTRQSGYITEHSLGGKPTVHGGITQVPLNEGPRDEIALRVNQCCNEAVEHLRLAEYAKAAEAYEKALQLDPENLSALNNLGVVYEKKPEWYGKSLRTWKQLLELSNRLPDEKHAARARKHIESLSKLVGAD
jgi:tetratricopeptide (TPR) repeat protein